MKILLTITGVFEGLTGLALMTAPALVVSVLLGTSLEGAAPMILARITGVALLSLAIACVQSRSNEGAPGVIKSMLFYNIAAAAVLLFGAIDYKLSGIGLWPTALLHAGLAVWCFVTLGQRKETTKSILPNK